MTRNGLAVLNLRSFLRRGVGRPDLPGLRLVGPNFLGPGGSWLPRPLGWWGQLILESTSGCAGLGWGGVGSPRPSIGGAQKILAGGHSGSPGLWVCVPILFGSRWFYSGWCSGSLHGTHTSPPPGPFWPLCPTMGLTVCALKGLFVVEGSATLGGRHAGFALMVQRAGHHLVALVAGVRGQAGRACPLWHAELMPLQGDLLSWH